MSSSVREREYLTSKPLGKFVGWVVVCVGCTCCMHNSFIISFGAPSMWRASLHILETLLVYMQKKPGSIPRSRSERNRSNTSINIRVRRHLANKKDKQQMHMD